MDCIEFSDVSFTYPAEPGDAGADGKPVVPQPVFDHFTGSIPAGGLTSLIGPNGSGKSTFLLLASGRLVPQYGTCRLLGQDAAVLPQEQKNLLASVIYQNMEFETREQVRVLLQFVYTHGALKGTARALRSGADLLSELVDVFELAAVLERPLVQLSKGEIQRVLLAFSILYGSASIFMDEPLFALEGRQKESALSYLRDYAARTGTAIFISMHELDLTRRYAQNVLLFYPNRDMDYGTPDEVLTDGALEKAYGVPVTMLKHAEDMTREGLCQTGDALLQLQRAEQDALARAQ